MTNCSSSPWLHACSATMASSTWEIRSQFVPLLYVPPLSVSSLTRWNLAVGYDSEMLLTWQPSRSYFLLCPTYHTFPVSASSNTALPEVLTGVPTWPVHFEVRVYLTIWRFMSHI